VQPKLKALAQANQITPLLQIRELKVHFPIYKGLLFHRQTGWIKAVDGLNFDIYPGETLGLVGESGCGKSTTGLAILQMLRPTSGDVYFQNINLTQLADEPLRQMRQQMQMVFQNPYASLNPRMNIGDILGEPLDIFGIPEGQTRLERIVHLLEMVGLRPEFAYRYPHEFSGGQRQRIVIARALALNPAFIVCDEPIAALDVSIQAQIVNLLQDLQANLGLTYLFISHDLSAVRHVSDRIAVMYLGKVVELADRQTLYSNPLHPYTQALLSAVPIPDPALEATRQRIVLQGDVPSPVSPPRGCRFHTRCPIAQDICRQEPEPLFQEVADSHYIACHMATSTSIPSS
jgi:oligopeptide transport system ATP-binding protein